MRYYLSSYKFGDRVDDLRRLRPANPRIGHINNARDWVGADPARANKHQREEIGVLNQLGFAAEPLDLQHYFGDRDGLHAKLRELGAVWVSGGNTFVLRMAMHLSGFDALFRELQDRDDFLYAGYSAGVCILSASLESIDHVDDPNNFPYPGVNAPMYDGLGAFPHTFLCHYDSDHPEAEAVAEEIQRCIDRRWLFLALRDGDVIIHE
ncbi:Type 1 glutamine amidotransferase-like domain-containing protein [Lewinella sp. W8]|uniref:Type 1 glutamine amidotransferase-like domain-containing protein n=1 Tax=Lewinella sp. W8 TaxID=2528208 RepID=UPI001067DE66|nr:Type 1 glutamine amidotransferase-like domain-containing protein [Lewinella sp. W8]MTB51128.1 hypothetical protein [Lewinella sp. W8]